jgi:ElaB/YqjD/DUF883 family membrane-anchored ribosome-binding protein
MSNTSPMARDTLTEAEGTGGGAGGANAATTGDIHEDLIALRDDVARLTQEIAHIVTARGGATWRKARSNVEGVLTQTQDKSQEAVDAVREVGENMLRALDESIKKRPYTTLGLALGIGFLFGATWRR